MEGASEVHEVDDLKHLPAGFRFHPTDEEIVTHYLTEKVMNSSFSARAIGEVDLNKCEPWDLPKKAKMGEKEWYFFCQRDRKYPTGMRTNRATESGYWKATGKDKEIYKGKSCLVGMKKTLVFYKGRAPKGEKTNWVMHEYRLEGKFSYYNFPKAAKDEWAVSRVFHKNPAGIKRSPIIRIDSFGDDLLDCPPLPPLMDPPPNSNDCRPGSSSCFTDGKDELMKRTAADSSARSSDGNYLSYLCTSMNENDDQQPKIKQQDHENFLFPSNYNYMTWNTTYLQLQDSESNPTIFYPDQIPLPNPIFPFQSSPNLGNYLHQERIGSIPTTFPAGSSFTFKGADHEAILRALAANHGTSSDLEMRQCKVEQISSNQNQSMVSLSQDTAVTGLSTDMTTEISSDVVSDLDCIWNY
ncbi:hypothetical protein F0562_016541 [Nyssa sinensis]|uniref:NAC domain-containing protein n=1 Tax=Nyssa sinensis TaxID=561372 RepID=A0A5J4ZFK0_9ASTE|nr:hypothetical protein F0562_016541 [Nyssa sinensis]